MADPVAAPATPRRGLLGRLVGSITQYVPTPRRAGSSNNEAPHEAQSASTHSPGTTPAENPASASPATEAEPWRPGMIPSKYLLEVENMFDDINKTPQRRPIRRPQTCPPKPRNTRANAIEMPRSAMKKRSAPKDDEEPPTPANNKRVKFNETLTQERILSPPRPGERESFPERRGTKRPRATDPYNGKHFADSPNIFDSESPSKKARYETSDESFGSADITPNTQNNTNMNAAVREEDTGYFVPNKAQPRPGTFELNYDTYGLGDGLSGLSEDDSIENIEAQPTPTYNPPSATTTPGRFTLEFSDDSSLVTDITPTPGPSQPPIRATSSSPPPLEPSTIQNESITTHLETTEQRPPTPPPNAASIDAETAALPWPKAVTYVEAGIASQHVINLLNDRYDEEDEYYAQLWWDREYEKFTNALKTAKKEGREIEIEL